MATILVTGANGFLGKFIVLGLLKRNVTHVICQVRGKMDETFLEQCRQQFPDSKLSTVRANLLDLPSLNEALKHTDVLIHAAAGTKGATADMVLNSVTGTQNLMMAAITNQIKRAVLVSSFAVYNTDSLKSGVALDEEVPIEKTGVKRGGYSYSKVRQEQVFHAGVEGTEIQTVVVRPGVVYGPGGGEFSNRLGVSMFGWFFNFGRDCELPLTYVENCGDACAEVAINQAATGVYNFVDQELMTCSEYLEQYRKNVRPLRIIPVPYFALMFGAKLLDRYYIYSKGQLPALFTPYVIRSVYRPFKHSPDKLVKLGWQQPVSLREGLKRAFESFKTK
jgi:nucleoside-diphosphate-sugar epimerase